jgi:TolB protein
MDGSGLRPLVDGGTDPAASPNGKKLLYVAGQDNFDVYVANADGTKSHRLTKTTRDETSPTWSPDAKWIAYEQTVDPRLVDPHNRIVVSRSNGKGAHVVITGKRYDPYYPNFRRGTKLPGPKRSSC